MQGRWIMGAGLLVSTTLGCSSSYMPVNSPGLSMVQEGGTVAFVRDGTKNDGGLFGGRIEEAVRGNREAEEQAHEYKNRLIGGAALGGWKSKRVPWAKRGPRRHIKIA